MTQSIDVETSRVLTILWVLWAVTSILVMLRLYTRLKILKMYGKDDHFYNGAYILFLAHNIVFQICANFGLGRSVTEIDSLDDVARAILYGTIGQTLYLIGMVTAKISMALFLLRLVTTLTDKIVIWIPTIVFIISALTSLIVFWLSCTPPAYLWDHRIDGHCYIDPGPGSLNSTIWSIIVDFWHTVFPWYLLWKLNMAIREKTVIAISMSFGIVAGICGIKKATNLGGLHSDDYTGDSPSLILWHTAELTATMFSIGIPICLPFYQHVLKGYFPACGNRRSRGLFGGNDYNIEINDLNLKTFQSIGGTIYSSNRVISAGTASGAGGS
ncbi:hypothetical protein F4810DRAFT_718066 [Camillea tinctor]|nr:hypothetical protein F4810DRAFT_718066 [Camillea tinctor]